MSGGYNWGIGLHKFVHGQGVSLIWGYCINMRFHKTISQTKIVTPSGLCNICQWNYLITIMSHIRW